jgi:hypothetical protein
MPQVLQKPDTWMFQRDAIDFIPLVVKVLGLPTTNYTIQVQPLGTDSDLAGTWSSPDTATPDTGYTVNGPLLSNNQAGAWAIYVKINDAPLAPVRHVVTLYLT